MAETTIIALVSACGTTIGAIISAIVALNVADKQYDKTTALVEYRLKELEEKVDKHNKLVERMTAVEARLSIYNKGD